MVSETKVGFTVKLFWLLVYETCEVDFIKLPARRCLHAFRKGHCSDVGTYICTDNVCIICLYIRFTPYI